MHMNRIYLLFIALICFWIELLEARVLIITHSYNRPDFIAYQYKTFKKFLKDDYDFVVFNDAPTRKLCHEIQNACKECGIRCIRVPPEIHQQPYLKRNSWEDWNSPSIRTANAVQYSFDVLGFDFDGIVAVFDSDMFLIRDFSIERYLEGYDLSAVGQWRGPMGCIHYLWNGIMFFNMNTLLNKRTINFNCGSVHGNLTDTGGYTYYYLKDNPQAKILYMREQLDITDGDYIIDSYELENRSYISEEELLNSIQSKPLVKLIQAQPDDVQLFLDRAILHYRRAGNYHNKSNQYHKKKTAILSDFITEILDMP
jgi:glycosyltransferase involved in cell wall biosynthesis